MTSVNGDVFCLNNNRHSTVIKAEEYFESVVSEFLSSSSRQNASVEARLKSCMKEITNTYMNKLHTPERTDWGDECYRCAYVYRLFAIHSYMVYQSLQLALADKERLTDIWRYKPSFRVCCIGGGPGSDALGLTKFLRDTGLVPTHRLECSIFDLRPEWEDTWQKITRSNASDEFPPMTYFSGDMTRSHNGLSINELDKVRSADIVSFVKFFSTVADSIGSNNDCGNLLREIFRELQPGALVLYIDNRYGNRDEEFKKIAAFGGVKEMLYKHHGQFCMPEAKRSVIMNRFDTITGKNPRNLFKVSVMLLRKPSDDKTPSISTCTSHTVIHTEAVNTLPGAGPIHTEADNGLPGAGPIHTEADNGLPGAGPIHTEADNGLPGAGPIHTEDGNGLSGAGPIHTEADNGLPGAGPIHTEDGNTLPEAGPIHTEADNGLPGEGHIPSTRSITPLVTIFEAESISPMITTPIVATGDIKPDVQAQDTDEMTRPLKLPIRCKPRSKSYCRYAPYW